MAVPREPERDAIREPGEDVEAVVERSVVRHHQYQRVEGHTG
jgi:hypothetical protein